MTSTQRATAMSPLQVTAAVVGVLFLLVGIAGFIPGITTDYDTMTAVSHESEAAIFGIFQVNVLHNVVHLLLGVIGVLAARTPSWARGFLIYGGIAYLALWIYGLVIDLDTAANFVALNTADNWLHLGLGAGMIVLGLVVPGRRT